MPDQTTQPEDEPKVITELRAEVADLRVHRTRMETRWSLIVASLGFVVTLAGSLGAGGLVAAISTRDAVHDNVSRIAAVERMQTEAATNARARESDDRSTREALVRLTVTVDSLRAQVADLTAEIRTRQTASQRPMGR